MRNTTGVLVRRTAGALLAVALLAGCGGGADDPPEEQGVSTGDLEEMHDALHEVQTLMDDANAGAAKFQGVVNQVRERNPTGAAGDPAVVEALAEQQELERARDEAIAELGEMPAADDPEVAEAYDAFAAAAEEMYTFQGGFNASMAEFLNAMEVCQGVFDVNPELAPTLMSIPGMYETMWHDEHDKRTRRCHRALDPIVASENVNMRKFVVATRTLMTQRTRAMTDIGVTKAQMDRALAKLKKANNTYIDRITELTAFSDELERLSADDEFWALHDVFEERLGLESEGDEEDGGEDGGGGEDSPSSSPESAPSD